MEHRTQARMPRALPPRTQNAQTGSARQAGSARGFSGRWSGLLTSLIVGVAFLAIIGWSVFKGQAPSSANGAPSGQPELLPEPEVTGPISTIPTSGKMYIEMTAKDDPNTLVGIIEADKVEPIDVNERLVEKPRAWIFLAGGRFGRIDADTGRFFMPDPNAAPESGLLEGNVRLRVFAPTANGEPPIADGDGAAEPMGIALFDEALRFDFRRSRVSSAGHFVIESPSFELAGTNMTVVFNEVQKRLELMEVRRGEYLKFMPTKQAASDTDPDSTGPDDANPALASSTAAGEADDAAPPTVAGEVAAAEPVIADVISFYHLTFLDGIDIAHQSHRLRGDQLDLWARLVNNTLPEDAIAQLATVASAETDSETPNPTANPATDPDTPSDAQENATTQTATPVTTVADDGTITMRWTGPMRVQPLGDDRPDALRNDQVAMRLTAEKTGLVAFDDAATGAQAKSVALDYGFTTANLAMSGPGGNVTLRVNDAAELQASRMIASLATGQIHIRGPGVMRVTDEAADGVADGSTGRNPEPTTIRWSEQADFEFAREGERVSSRLASAILDGNVEATNGLDRLSGTRFDATFALTALGKQRLDTLRIDSGRAEDRAGGYLTGETLAVEFADGTLGHDMDAVRIDAWGNARAGKPGSEIQAGTLTASLGRDLEGNARIERIDASQAVVFNGEDGSRTRSETMMVDTLTNSIDLIGPDAMLAYRGSTITGPEIRIDGQNRRARVIGVGSFDQEMPAQGDKPAGRVLAIWTQSMTYDDFLGRVECLGDAVVTSSPVPTQLDTVKAQRVLITMSPYDEASPTRNDAMRRLLTATAYGGNAADGTPTPASVESRAFKAADRVLVEQLMYLEGMQIIANNETSELAVPSAGKLLLLDRRPSVTDAAPTAEVATAQDTAGQDPAQQDPAQQDRAILTELATGGPGLTRFEWRGGMLLNRINGTVSMKRSVKITHRNLATEQTYELHAERLDATIRDAGSQGNPGETPTGQTPTGQTTHSELVRAQATGAVYFGSAQRELIADRLLYDAENGVVIGTAAPGNLVTLFDATTGTPITSRAIRWDLVNDVISIERPGAIVAPAGP